MNNAGVYSNAPLAEIEEQEFHRRFNLNVLGLIQCTREAVGVFNPEGDFPTSRSLATSIAWTA